MPLRQRRRQVLRQPRLGAVQRLEEGGGQGRAARGTCRPKRQTARAASPAVTDPARASSPARAPITAAGSTTPHPECRSPPAAALG
ncbi:hypothetical protein ACFQY5_12405 [Paeniroseomonas aquatica]|uniref:hypothetical protein n=1 Tax=Paeniroseomonas aquatica TaxID=373043 RepID=UPI00361C21B9